MYIINKVEIARDWSGNTITKEIYRGDSVPNNLGLKLISPVEEGIFKFKEDIEENAPSLSGQLDYFLELVTVGAPNCNYHALELGSDEEIKKEFDNVQNFLDSFYSIRVNKEDIIITIGELF